MASTFDWKAAVEDPEKSLFVWVSNPSISLGDVRVYIESKIEKNIDWVLHGWEAERWGKGQSPVTADGIVSFEPIVCPRLSQEQLLKLTRKTEGVVYTAINGVQIEIQAGATRIFIGREDPEFWFAVPFASVEVVLGNVIWVEIEQQLWPIQEVSDDEEDNDDEE